MDLKTKNILLVSTYDTGGAAKSCLRLHIGLLQSKLKSKVLLKKKTVQGIPHTYEFPIQDKQLGIKKEILNKIRNLINLPFSKKERETLPFSRLHGLEMYSFPHSEIDITNSFLYRQADIINFHWVANFLDWESFFKINNIPVIWTLHDMNPFLGIEHYVEKYLFKDENSELNQIIKSDSEKHFNKKIVEKKQASLKKFQKLTIVAPSKWLVEEAKKSSLFSCYNIHYIPYGLNSEIFNKRNKNLSREFFGIPKEKSVILFVAQSITNNRKGFTILKQAFDSLKSKDFILSMVGKNIPKSMDNIFDMGSICDDRLMSLAYSAADVLVIPSLIDNLPNTALESIMCGTPVIGFPVGGIPEIIQNGLNGYLTDEVSVSSLHSTLVKFFENSNKFCSATIRENALKKYDSQIQARAYEKLFEEILNTHS